MGSRRSRKAKARETLAYQIENVLSPTLSDSMRRGKDSDNLSEGQKICLRCINRKKCPGWCTIKVMEGVR